jgi:hypothetical protein
MGNGHSGRYSHTVTRPAIFETTSTSDSSTTGLGGNCPGAGGTLPGQGKTTRGAIARVRGASHGQKMDVGTCQLASVQFLASRIQFCRPYHFFENTPWKGVSIIHRMVRKKPTLSGTMAKHSSHETQKACHGRAWQAATYRNPL